MIDSVKSGAEVQQHQGRHKTSVRGSYDIVVHNGNGGLGRMISMLGRLALRSKLVLRRVIEKTVNCQPFNNLRDETEVGDRSIRLDVEWVQ